MNRNEFLDADASENSDHDEGYDSEAAELSKGRNPTQRASKRRKLSPANNVDRNIPEDSDASVVDEETRSQDEEQDNAVRDGSKDFQRLPSPKDAETTTTARRASTQSVLNRSRDEEKQKKKQKKPPGVIYLSSLPPYLKPSALRNLLTQRGFSPITRLFLSPASKAKTNSNKNSRQLYTEGWIEFASKKTARMCAEALNASPVGGKKGGFYYDDVWNMRYLKGMGWDELMAGVREERREQEGRRDEERRIIARETKGFVEGVEEGRKVEGMKRKRAGKDKAGVVGGTAIDGNTTGAMKRTWRQFEVKGPTDDRRRRSSEGETHPVIEEDVKRVLGKIF